MMRSTTPVRRQSSGFQRRRGRSAPDPFADALRVGELALLRSTSPATRPLRQATVQRLEAQVGNARLARLLQRSPEIPTTEKAATKHMLAQMNAANQRKNLSSGVWYPGEFFNKSQASEETRALWKDDFIDGHAAPDRFEQVGYMDWKLKPGESASAAIRAWLKGPTIAECFSTIVAIQWETLRAMLGDEPFDRLCGSSDPAVDAAIPAARRLRVRNGWTVPASSPDAGAASDLALKQLISPTGSGSGTLGDRPAQPGARYYFGNHPKFKHKHPDPTNNLAGENALFAGWRTVGGKRTQIWEGLGMAGRTEEQILDELAAAWNAPRAEGDYRVILLITLGADKLAYLQEDFPDLSFEDLYLDNIAQIPAHLRDDVDSDLNQTLTGQALDALDPAYDEVTNRMQSPGFRPSSGVAFDVTKVKALRKALSE